MPFLLVLKTWPDLGALQRLQQGLRSELPCNWPQVQPLQLVQHPIDITARRFIRKQLADNRLVRQQPVVNSSHPVHAWQMKAMPGPYNRRKNIVSWRAASLPSNRQVSMTPLPSFCQDSIHSLNPHLLSELPATAFVPVLPRRTTCPSPERRHCIRLVGWR